jgi:hypothetical protein
LNCLEATGLPSAARSPSSRLKENMVFAVKIP